MNLGRFDATVEAEVAFTSSDVVAAIRANDRVMIDFALRNADFGALIDIMSATVDQGDKQFPTNQSVTLRTTSMGFQDPTLASTAGISVFAYLPAA
jgi:hypothetical protein